MCVRAGARCSLGVCIFGVKRGQRGACCSVHSKDWKGVVGACALGEQQVACQKGTAERGAYVIASTRWHSEGREETWRHNQNFNSDRNRM